MLCLIYTMDQQIICDTLNTWQSLYCLVELSLKDFRGDIEAKWKTQISEATKWGNEGCEARRFLIKFTVPKPELQSTLENTLLWESLGSISSRVRSGYLSRVRTLLRFLRSRHTLNSPLFFSCMEHWLTHGVGSSTLVMTPLTTISSSFYLSFAFLEMGTVRGGHWTG